MDQLTVFLNTNPGLGALLGAFLATALMGFLLAARLGRTERGSAARAVEYERYRRRQFQDLTIRVERANERMSHDMQLMNQLLNASAQSGEERVSQLCERTRLLTEQNARQFEALRQSVETKQDRLRGSVEEKLRDIQNSNEKRLDEMRQTVDQKMQETLNRRLGESFRQVSEQLERVYKGLGEMQKLAGGVGDLKKVLTGVKTRGIWGEVRLGNLLEQTLTREQYLENTPVVPGSAERVEFAVRLPGREGGEGILLAIDSKFPAEDYQRLTEASEGSDRAAVEQAASALEKALLREADRIASKYIRVPYTTDFAIMFLPVEGLFAEALRRPGLLEKMQTKYRVMPAGPTTLSALLASLQLGFRTLAVEKRSEEIWQLLGSVRDEFSRFGEALDKTRQKLEQAGEELDSAARKSKRITRQLTQVGTLPVPEEWSQSEDN